jgi:hypothetical protein
MSQKCCCLIDRLILDQLIELDCVCLTFAVAPGQERGEVPFHKSGDLQAELNEKEDFDITHNSNLGARNDIAKT